MSLVVDRGVYSDLMSRLDRLELRLSNFSVEAGIVADTSFLSLMRELESIARDSAYSSLVSELERSSAFKKKCSFFQKIYEIFEIFIETESYMSCLSSGFDLSDERLQRTFTFAQREAQAAGFTKDSHVVFVGSGPFPETAFAYARLIGCKVTCVDTSPEAVLLSSRLIDKLGLSHLINVVCADGGVYDYASFSHVVVAALARPKGAILRQVCKTSGKDISILCRTVEGIRRLIYEPIDELPLEHFDLCGKIQGLDSTIVHSLLLRHRAHYTLSFLRPADAHKAREFCLRVIKESYGFDYRADWHADLDSLPDYSGMYSRDREGAFVIASSSDCIVGCGGLRSLNSKYSLAKRFAGRYSGKTGSLWRLYIESTYRKQGIGREIVRLLEEQARTFGYDFLYLHTSRSHPYVIDFWQGQGYAIFAEDADGTVHMDKALKTEVATL